MKIFETHLVWTLSSELIAIGAYRIVAPCLPCLDFSRREAKSYEMIAESVGED